jgi:hypothetical protein
MSHPGQPKRPAYPPQSQVQNPLEKPINSERPRPDLILENSENGFQGASGEPDRLS